MNERAARTDQRDNAAEVTMRTTTLSLPEPLILRVKQVAYMRRVTMAAVIGEALEAHLATSQPRNDANLEVPGDRR